MIEGKEFPIESVLSVSTGRLFGEIGGVYEILNFMTGEDLFTHQLPRAAEACRPALRAQHPALSAVALAHDIASRVQRLRAKGWRMPPNTVYVGRPTKWGNQWTVSAAAEAGYSVDEAVCVEAYRAWLLGERHWAHGSPPRPVPMLEPLRGKNLACWCPLDQPCHADVLLEIANR